MSVDYQKVLEQLAADRLLNLTPLKEVVCSGLPRKVACCGGWVSRIYAESAVDSSVVLRDASGAVLCVFHEEIVSRYPDILTSGALVLLQDVSFIRTPGVKVPPFLVAGLRNLTSLMVPEESAPVGCPPSVLSGEGGLHPSNQRIDSMVCMGSKDSAVDARRVTSDWQTEDPYTMGQIRRGEMESNISCNHHHCEEELDQNSTGVGRAPPPPLSTYNHLPSASHTAKRPRPWDLEQAGGDERSGAETFFSSHMRDTRVERIQRISPTAPTEVDDGICISAAPVLSHSYLTTLQSPPPSAGDGEDDFDLHCLEFAD